MTTPATGRSLNKVLFMLMGDVEAVPILAALDSVWGGLRTTPLQHLQRYWCCHGELCAGKPW